jgi:adenylylsulfate kinase
MSGLVLWITGLPGSGKSTVADGIKERRPGIVVLRMDRLRKIVTPNPTYSEAERDTVYRCIVYMAQTLSQLGHDVIIDATGNLRRWRDLARNTIPNFAEAYLKCPVEVCEMRESARVQSRDAPKAIYEKGKAGWPVPGLQAPYEEPLNPEITIETDKTAPSDASSLILQFLQRRRNEQVSSDEG